MDKEIKLSFTEAQITPDSSPSLDNIWGFFPTVSIAPTNAPKRFQEQVVVYVNGATFRLYWYDASANIWHYVTATA